MIKELAIIIVSVVFVNNFVLAKFLGLCPFLGVSQKTSSALGMGAAVTFVMTLASAITWILYNYILLPGDANLVGMVFPSIGETGLIEVLKTISYILVIATLVQLVEMMLRKMVPALYDSLGVFIGFTVAILLMSGIRERLALLSIPKPLQGLPIAFICTGLMALAFFGFSGMVP